MNAKEVLSKTTSEHKGIEDATRDRFKPYRENLHWIVLVSLIIGVSIAEPTFFSLHNMLSMFSDVVPLFFMALGITFVIYIGGIDLATQSVANLITVIATISLVYLGTGSIALCLLVSATAGVGSGMITCYLKVPSFVSTLAIGGMSATLAQWWSGQRALYMNVESREASFGWLLRETAGIPNVLLLAAVVTVICAVLQYRTVFGRQLKAVGCGELAARAAGIKVSRIKIIAFGLSGLLAGLSGLVFSVKLSGGSPTIAEGFLLPAIAAVLIGGTPLTGGVGGVVNTIAGVLIIVVMRASMVYFEVTATYQQIVFGLILLIAIAMTVDRSKLATIK